MFFGDAPPIELNTIHFDPEAFAQIGTKGSIPSDLMTLDGKHGANGAMANMTLLSRSAQEQGTFYIFEDPANPAAHASLFLRDGRLTGAIYWGDALRTVLSSDAPGLSRVSIEDAGQDLPCATTGHDMPDQPLPLDGGVAGACDDGSKVDLLVVYTDAAIVQAGTEVSLLDSIAWAIADSNSIYTGSNIALSARLVGTARMTGYVENASMSVDLSRLTNPADGFLDGVHALRNAAGADLVALIRADGGGACGVAWLLPTNSSTESPLGFSVCALGCFTNRTLTHELGHNMGCCHAPNDGGGCTTGGVFSYSVGHRFTGSDGATYRTVMAYQPGTRIPRFSSPGIVWAGVATGIAGTRDNARTIRETKLAFSNFRCSADGVGSCGSGGNCYAQHAGPGCNSAACCEAVCAIDNYCCLTSWDFVCVSEALNLCSNCGDSGAGSCLAAHSTPSCSDATCCSLVCAADPYCCTNQWDSICVSRAVELCPSCGDAVTGSCYVVHPTTFCDNAVCCDLVCDADPFCCTNRWDFICSARAINDCAGCGNPNAGSCYATHITPFCADAECCASVCAADAYCCNNHWDSVCASTAISNCAGCGNPSGGGCLAVHTSPFCSDAACCLQVCDVDPFCCASGWDTVCVTESLTACVNTCGGSLSGSCCVAHANPFCDDAVCCGTVCVADSYCCTVRWDSICANRAATTCQSCAPPCPTDFNSNGVTDAADLSILLSGWSGSGADLNGNGNVDAADLAILLSAWGPCP